MLRFELKKFFKKKVFLSIGSLALILTVYSFIVSPMLEKMSLVSIEDVKITSKVYNRLNIFFDNFEEPEEIKDRIDERMLEVEDDSFILDALKNQEAKSNTSIELKNKYLKIQLSKNMILKEVIKEFKDQYPEFSKEENKGKIDYIDWQILKYEKLLEANGDDPYLNIDPYGYNSLQKLFKSSNILFGLPSLILFLVLFSSYFSKEREGENLNLLYTQGFPKRRVIIAKSISIVLTSAMYIGFVFLFSLIIFLISKVPISGFNDIYRVFNVGDGLKFITGKDLLIRLLLAYFTISLFWSFLGFFLSTRFKSNDALAISIIIFSLAAVFTKNLELLKTTLNPMYMKDIVARILGEFVPKTDSQGLTEIIQVYGNSIKTYLPIFIYSIILFVLSLIPSYEIYRDREKKKKKIYSLSIFRLEMKKILNTQGAVFYFIGILIIISSIFISYYNIDKGYERNFLGYNSEFMAEDIVKSQERIISLYKDPENMDKMFSRNGKTIKVSDWDEKIWKMYNEELRIYEQELEAAKLKVADLEKKLDSYKESDGENFYKIEEKYILKDFDTFKPQARAKTELTEKSKDLNIDIYKQASKNNTKPIFGEGIFISPYEKFTDLEAKEDIVANAFKRGHDGFYFPYRMVRNNSFDIILLALASLMVMGGYTMDKEKGRQFELNSLSPISKTKFYINKTVSQYLASLLVILVVFVFMILLGGISDGFSAYNYPVASYGNNTYKLIYLWQYLGKLILFLGLILLFIASLMTLLSLFVKTKTILLIATGMVFILGRFITGYLPEAIKALSPFIYLKANLLADNSLVLINGIKGASSFMATGVLLMWSLVNILIGIVFVKARFLSKFEN